MKVKKRIFAFILCLCLISASAGCNNNNADYSPLLTPPERITWGIVKYNPYIESVNTSSEIMKYISQKFNCNIEFKYYSSFNTKILKQMLNSENCPDILTMETMSIESRYLAANEFVVPADCILPKSEYGKIPKETVNLLAEFDETLYGIPGRYAIKEQLENAVFPKNEGIYIYKPYYKLLGSPAIRDINDIITVSNEFILRFNELRSAAGFNPDDTESSEPLPVIIDSSGNGIETLKHIFGIYPVFQNGSQVSLSIASPKWTALAKWLYSVSLISTKSMSLSKNAVSNALEGQNLFFIGSSPCINKVNFKTKSFDYEILKLNTGGKTFSVNPYGSCQTYVMNSSNSKETVIKLLSFLFSENGNFLVKYGIENKHWIRTGNSPLQLEWVNEALHNDYFSVSDSIGIGQVLFLTNLENDNINTPNLLSTEKNAFFSTLLKYNFSSGEAIKINKLNELEINLCQRIASIDTREYPQKYSMIMSELSYFPLYEQQYRIDSLEDNYSYWKQQGLIDTIY